MPTNAELRAQAAELAAELDITVSTDRMNNSALTELVSDLQERKELAQQEVLFLSPEPTPVEPPHEEPTVNGLDDGALGGLPEPGAPVVGGYPYVVAPGRTVTCKRGTIGAYGRISASDVGGPEELARMVEIGAVVQSAR